MPIFGNSAAETVLSSSGTNTVFYGGYYAGGPTSGTLSSISTYLKYGSGSHNVEMAVYGATSGNLIGSTAAFAVSTTAGWFTESASGTLNDPNGNYYIFVCASTSTTLDRYNSSTTGGGGEYEVTGMTYGTWPSTISATLLGSGYNPCAYFTYSVAAAPNSNFLAFM
jgi:hypothetical protein